MLVMLALAVVPAGMIAWNLAILRRPCRGPSSERSVSVLIPARNEERNIRAALESVLTNRDAGLEVLVLDDHSTDATAAIVREVATRDQRVRLIAGNELPAGCCGKPFACMQLAARATGEVLLFMDADVRLGPTAIREIAAGLDRSEAAMVSGIPRQETRTLGELLIVPLIHFVMFAYLPMALMRRSLRVSLGAACGQLYAVDRRAYESSGGHAAIADRVHDAIALARRLRKCGYQTDIIDIGDHAICRMYGSWAELVSGFAKNAHEGLGSSRGIVPWTGILIGGHVAPVACLLAAAPGPSDGAIALALVSSLAGRVVLSIRFGQSTLGALLHPVGVAALVCIQWYALIRRISGRPIAWKDRVPIIRSESPPRPT